MLHFTLDVFDIEPEVEEKIKGLVEKNNKEYKERNHKWNFDENLGFFNINCHTSSSYYLTELKNILFNEVQEDQYTLDVDFGEEVLGTAYIIEGKVMDNMEKPEEEKFNLVHKLIYTEKPDSCILFCNTREKVKALFEKISIYLVKSSAHDIIFRIGVRL